MQVRERDYPESPIPLNYEIWLKLYRASYYVLSYIPELRGIGLSGDSLGQGLGLGPL